MLWAAALGSRNVVPVRGGAGVAELIDNPVRRE
jgi:hypothetical protein